MICDRKKIVSVFCNNTWKYLEVEAILVKKLNNIVSFVAWFIDTNNLVSFGVGKQNHAKCTESFSVKKERTSRCSQPIWTATQLAWQREVEADPEARAEKEQAVFFLTSMKISRNTTDALVRQQFDRPVPNRFFFRLNLTENLRIKWSLQTRMIKTPICTAEFFEVLGIFHENFQSNLCQFFQIGV